MSEQKINDRQLLKLIDEGASQSEAARQLGVSKQAVHTRLKQLRGKVPKAVVAQKIEKLADRQLDAMAQLIEINRKSLELLDQAERENDKGLQLKCIAEVRSQLKLCLEIYEGLFNIRTVEEFMVLLINTLKEADPHVYQRFRERLNGERSLRSVLRFA